MLGHRGCRLAITYPEILVMQVRAIVDAAIQEDVDMIGLSTLSGAHNSLFPKVVRQLTERGAGDIIVFGGGVIPDADIPGLKEAGIQAVFTPGTPIKEIISFIEEVTT